MKVTKETTILESVKNYKAVNEDLKAETDGEDIKVKATDDPGNVEAIALVDRRRNACLVHLSMLAYKGKNYKERTLSV